MVVVGATGQLGRSLCGELICAGHPVVVFSRDPSRARDVVPGAADYVSWSPDELPRECAGHLEWADAVVYLAGGPLFDGRRHSRADVVAGSVVAGSQVRAGALRQLVAPLGELTRLLAVNFVACLLLLIQYLLGMAVNIYVALPAAHPGASASDYFTGAASGLAWVIPHGPAWAAVHAAYGLALVLAAFASIALARGQGSRTATVMSVLGALAILGAAFNGVSFLNYGHAFSSMIMAGLWALALACYLTGMFLARPASGNPA